MHLKFIKTHIFSAQSQQSNFIIPSMRVHNRIDINHREEVEGGVICEDSVLFC